MGGRGVLGGRGCRLGEWSGGVVEEVSGGAEERDRKGRCGESWSDSNERVLVEGHIKR